MAEEREEARRCRPGIMVLSMSGRSDIAIPLRRELDDGIELPKKPFRIQMLMTMRKRKQWWASTTFSARPDTL